MIAARKVNAERVFVPIVPIRISQQNRTEKQDMMSKMQAKNPALQQLIAAFDLY